MGESLVSQIQAPANAARNNSNNMFYIQESCRTTVPVHAKELQRIDEIVFLIFNFFQETHLRPQQHDTVRLPLGHSIHPKT
jgi:hypothetical protein